MACQPRVLVSELFVGCVARVGLLGDGVREAQV